MNKTKVLLIDLSNMIMRCLFSQMPSPTEKKFDMFKAVFFSSFFKTIAEHSPNMVICCIDGSSWRKDIYSGYKGDRQAKRDQSIVDFDAFFDVWGKLLSKMKEVFAETNIKFLEVEKTEADDQIATIVKYHPEWEITNVSTDRDFYQLFRYPHYHQWNPIKGEFMSTLNPENDLLIKIICGDKSDSIKGIKKGVGEKTALKIINNDLQAWLDENQLNEAFQLNTQLVSFESIPTIYVDTINEKVKQFTLLEQPSAKAFSNFAYNCGINMVSLNCNEYIEILKSIK